MHRIMKNPQPRQSRDNEGAQRRRPEGKVCKTTSRSVAKTTALFLKLARRANKMSQK